jgi:hypothetical protein
MRIPRLVQDTRRAAQQAIVQCDEGAGEVSHFACQPAFRTTFSTLRWLRSFFGQHPAECTIGYLDLRLGEYFLGVGLPLCNATGLAASDASWRVSTPLRLFLVCRGVPCVVQLDESALCHRPKA